MTLELVLVPDSSVPIFRQIADGLRASMARGAVGPDNRLPSVRALAESLGVNPNTVHKAFTELEREGLVVGERGRGMVVRDGVRRAARTAGEESVVDRLADAVRLAQAIGVPEERFQVLLRRAQRMAGDRSAKENTHGD